MAAKRRKSAKARKAASARAARSAVAIGKEIAAEVLTFRNAALRRRTAALRQARPAAMAARAVKISPQRIRAAGGPGSAGVLVAEGDSWFDYPWHDVLRMLEDRHGYDVESVAHKGDRVEDMAYSGGQLEEFTLPGAVFLAASSATGDAVRSRKWIVGRTMRSACERMSSATERPAAVAAAASALRCEDVFLTATAAMV